MKPKLTFMEELAVKSALVSAMFTLDERVLSAEEREDDEMRAACDDMRERLRRAYCKLFVEEA